MAQFQPVHLEDPSVQQGEVMDATGRLRAGVCIRSLGARRRWGQVVCSRRRLPDPLPQSVHLRAVGGDRDCHSHAKLPVEPSAPKGKHRPGRFCQFADLVAARVRVNAQRLLVHIRVSKHHRTGVRRTIAIHCRQNRSSPGVVTVYAGSSKLFPDLLENILRRV